MYLDFVDRDSQRGYIVALRYVKAEMDESPALLGPRLPAVLIILIYSSPFEDLERLGDPCCQDRCGNVEAHLLSIWSEYRVVKAKKILDGRCVLAETFDDNLFDGRTNNLFIELIPQRTQS
jgi:hypothetical protein